MFLGPSAPLYLLVYLYPVTGSYIVMQHIIRHHIELARMILHMRSTANRMDYARQLNNFMERDTHSSTKVAFRLYLAWSLNHWKFD